MGDPAGIGPELCLRLLHEIGQNDHLDQIPLIFGDSNVLKQVSKRIGVPIKAPVVSPSSLLDRPAIVHCPTNDLSDVVPGQVNP